MLFSMENFDFTVFTSIISNPVVSVWDSSIMMHMNVLMLTSLIATWDQEREGTYVTIYLSSMQSQTQVRGELIDHVIFVCTK